MGVTEIARWLKAIEAIVKPQGVDFDFEGSGGGVEWFFEVKTVKT